MRWLQTASLPFDAASDHRIIGLSLLPLPLPLCVSFSTAQSSLACAAHGQAGRDVHGHGHRPGSQSSTLGKYSARS